MSTVKKDCAYCRQPIRLTWKNGLVLTEDVCLVADQVFHDKCRDEYLVFYNKCWDEYRVKYHAKRQLPEVAGVPRCGRAA